MRRQTRLGPRSGGVEQGPTKRSLREVNCGARAGQQGENPNGTPQLQSSFYMNLAVGRMNKVAKNNPISPNCVNRAALHDADRSSGRRYPPPRR